MICPPFYFNESAARSLNSVGRHERSRFQKRRRMGIEKATVIECFVHLEPMRRLICHNPTIRCAHDGLRMVA